MKLQARLPHLRIGEHVKVNPEIAKELSNMAKKEKVVLTVRKAANNPEYENVFVARKTGLVGFLLSKAIPTFKRGNMSVTTRDMNDDAIKSYSQSAIRNLKKNLKSTFGFGSGKLEK